MDKTNPLVKFLRATLGSKWGSRITYYGVFPALVILSLLLPPFSLGERTLYAGYTAISQEGGLVMDAYGAQLIIPPGAATRTLRLRLMPIPGSSFLSGQVEGDVAQAAPAIPPFLNLASPFYRLDIKGKPPSEAILALPMLHEAFILNFIDDMDAKINYMERLSSQVKEEGYQWSEYQRNLERFLFLRGHKEQEESQPETKAREEVPRPPTLWDLSAKTKQ